MPDAGGINESEEPEDEVRLSAIHNEFKEELTEHEILDALQELTSKRTIGCETLVCCSFLFVFLFAS